MEEPKLQTFLRRAMRLREIYMNEAMQIFPEMTKRALHKTYKSNYTPETGIDFDYWFAFVTLLLLFSF